MAADVAVRAQLALLVAHDEHRLRAGEPGDVAARARQRGDVAGQLPGPLEDPLLLDLEQLRVEVEPGLERLGDRGLDVGDSGHMRNHPDFVISLLLVYRPWSSARPWLSVTPEPERELPDAVATLRRRRRRRPMRRSPASARRIERLVLRGSERRWRQYLHDVVELIDQRRAMLTRT